MFVTLFNSISINMNYSESDVRNIQTNGFVHNFSYITFIGIHMTFKPKKNERDMERYGIRWSCASDGFKTANCYNGSIHVSGTGQRRQLST